MANGIGRRQRKILDDMLRYGQGQWPPGWRINNDNHISLIGLQRRGFIKNAGTTWTITAKGRALVNWDIRPLDLAGKGIVPGL